MIHVFDRNGNYISHYESVKTASLATEISELHIYSVLNGTREFRGGKIFVESNPQVNPLEISKVIKDYMAIKNKKLRDYIKENLR